MKMQKQLGQKIWGKAWKWGSAHTAMGPLSFFFLIKNWICERNSVLFQLFRVLFVKPATAT